MSRSASVTSGPYAPPVPSRELTVVSADGARLHVEVHGPDDAPPVVLSHGWTCSTAFWAAQIRDLAGDHRVVAYDQRGHGRSPANPACTTEVLADDLEAVLGETLAPGEKALIVGHSMGGMTVMAAASRPRFREHAAAVLLCSTGSSRLVAESRVLPLRAGRVRTWITGRILGSRAPLGPVTPVAKSILRYATMGAGSAPHMVEACARIVHACPRAVRHAWAAVLEALDLDHGVRELHTPTAVIHGASDRLTPPVHAHALVAALPHCIGLTELPGVGHMTPIEAPGPVTGRIRELVTMYVAMGTTPEATGATPEATGATPEATGTTPEVTDTTREIAGATPEVAGATPVRIKEGA